MRGDRWVSAMGREQTELDAAVALAPDQFAEVVEDSLLQYFDTSLASRASAICADLEARANARLAEQVGPELLDDIRTDAGAEAGEQPNEFGGTDFTSALNVDAARTRASRCRKRPKAP